jgi:hypothetical protein
MMITPIMHIDHLVKQYRNLWQPAVDDIKGD